MHAGRLRRLFAAHPLRTGVAAGSALLLLGGAAAGAYHLRTPFGRGTAADLEDLDARILLRRPFCGAGLGNFAGAFGEEQDPLLRRTVPARRRETRWPDAPKPDSRRISADWSAETGAAGFALLLLLTGTAVAAGIRRGDPFGYGLLAAAVFASFSYPWSVLPLRLLFVVLLAGAASPPGDGGVPAPGRRPSPPLRTLPTPSPHRCSRRASPARRASMDAPPHARRPAGNGATSASG